MSCGKVLGGGMGYSMRCGCPWMGSIAKCSDCEREESEIENLKLQNRALKESLKNKKI